MLVSPGASGGSGLVLATASHDTDGNTTCTGPLVAPPWLTISNGTSFCPPRTMPARSDAGWTASSAWGRRMATLTGRSTVTASALVTRNVKLAGEGVAAVTARP